MAVDKAALLSGARLLEHKEVEVPGVGTVTIRGLSRAEAFQVQEAESNSEREAILLAGGLVEPTLTVEEARAWRAGAPAAEVGSVSDAILALSGLAEGQQTEAEARFRTGDS